MTPLADQAWQLVEAAVTAVGNNLQPVQGSQMCWLADQICTLCVVAHDTCLGTTKNGCNCNQAIAAGSVNFTSQYCRLHVRQDPIRQALDYRRGQVTGEFEPPPVVVGRCLVCSRDHSRDAACPIVTCFGCSRYAGESCLLLRAAGAPRVSRMLVIVLILWSLS